MSDPTQAKRAAAPPPPPPTRRFASQEQAARHFQRTPKTIRNWIGRGHITGFRLGPRRVVVDLNEIEAFLASAPATVARDGRKAYGPHSRIVDMSNVAMSVEEGR